MKIKIKKCQYILRISILIVIALIQVIQLLHLDQNVIYACGLFAFIGDNPGRYFNWDKFNILGLLNDSRGGDACGRVVDNKVMWGVDKLKNYEDFVCQIPSIPLKVTSNTVLGHCRKASSGGKADIYAQPVVFFKKDLDMKRIKDTHMISGLKNLNDDDIVFSGIHNGTIENYLDLADKYQIDTINHNDTRVLLSILFYGEHKVLKEYIGTAALIWQNHVLNKTYVFKGQSKSWSSSVEANEERPLFAYPIAKNNLYISSLENSLEFIQTKKEGVISINSNTLYKFLAGVNYASVKYDRSSCTQNKTYTGGVSNRVVGFNGKHTPNLFPEKYENQREIEYEEAWRQYDRGCDLPWDKDKIGYRDGERFIRTLNVGKEDSFRITFEMTDKFTNKLLKAVVYNKTRYWMHGGLMHGVYVLSQGGIVPVNTYAQGSTVLKPYYFVEGIIMDGLPAYNVAKNLHKAFMKDLNDVLLDNQNTEEEFTREIARYSRYAIAPLLNTNIAEICFSPIGKGTYAIDNLYTGEYLPLFSSKKYKFELGELTGVSDIKSVKSGSHDWGDDQATKLYLKDVKVSPDSDPVWSVGSNLLLREAFRNPLSPFQNYIINNCDFTSKDYEAETLFMINYLKDFDANTIVDCRTCVNKDSKFTITCQRCMKLKTNLALLKEPSYYGVYD